MLEGFLKAPSDPDHRWSRSPLEMVINVLRRRFGMKWQLLPSRCAESLDLARCIMDHLTFLDLDLSSKGR